MTTRKTILNELSDLGSTLGNHIPEHIYGVPDGYFQELPVQILNRIKALYATDANDELAYLSTLLGNGSKRIPYSVPDDYFQNLADDLLKKVNENAGQISSDQEIATLSPLLSSLKNKNPYFVPAGYFEALQNGIGKPETKVISITKRRWYRLAVAAIFIGVIAIGGLLFSNQSQPDVNKDPQAWINKNVNKKISTEKIDAFVKMAEDETLSNGVETDASKQAEIKELMKDVPEKEIEEFLNDAIAFESNDETSIPMNE